MSACLPPIGNAAFGDIYLYTFEKCCYFKSTYIQVKILGLNEANANEGVYCLDGLQQNDIKESFYVTSDGSETTSISDASKLQNSVEECKFEGNMNDGFELNFSSGEWSVIKIYKLVP